MQRGMASSRAPGTEKGMEPEVFCARATRGLRMMRGSRQTVLLARRAPTIKKIGRTPTLVLCSRNARPKKGLVRRAHLDQHGCPSRNAKRASLEGAL